MKWEEWKAIADNESLWVNYEEKGLLKAEHVRDHILRLWFDDGPDVSIYELDFRPLFVDDNPGGVFAPLKDVERFKRVEGDYALIWYDPTSGKYNERTVDLAPECVRFFCEKYGVKIKRAHKSQIPV